MLRLGAQTRKTRPRALPVAPPSRGGEMPGLVLDQWLGVFAPPATPPAITTLLNSEMNKALADPTIRKTLVDSAQEPTGGTIDSFAQFVRDDYAKYGRLVKELHIKVE